MLLNALLGNDATSFSSEILCREYVLGANINLYGGDAS
jgi:hypothetical protein